MINKKYNFTFGHPDIEPPAILKETIINLINKNMSEKIYVRKIETQTISSASNPIEVNVEALRKCEPPYEGDSEQEFVNYLQNEVWNEYEFYENETNK